MNRKPLHELLMIICILGILAAIVIPHFLEFQEKQREKFTAAKIQKLTDIDKNWQEKNCDYFADRAVEEAKEGDAEKAILYLKLNIICIDLRFAQPKTPQ